MKFDCIKIASASGRSLTVPVTSVAITIPTTLVTVEAASGRSNNPRYVRIIPEAACYINFGTTSAVSCSTLVGTLITPNDGLQIYDVAGYSYIGAIAKTATVINITPVEV